MITRLKKTSVMLAVCLLLGGAGLVSGNAVQNAIAPAPVAAYCEEDFCYDGLGPLNDYCDNAPGFRWNCNDTGESCESSSCGPQGPIFLPPL